MATPEPLMSLETFVGSLKPSFLACRDLGHVWQPFNGSYDETAGVFEREMRCRSCKTIRRQTVTSAGHVLKNRYTYVDGYQMKNVVRDYGHYSRDTFRVEALTRFLTKGN
jgi:hypothetical protein